MNPIKLSEYLGIWIVKNNLKIASFGERRVDIDDWNYKNYMGLMCRMMTICRKFKGTLDNKSHDIYFEDCALYNFSIVANASVYMMNCLLWSNK